MLDYLPDQKLIAKRQKTVDLISISSQGICGEDDSGFPGLKKARFPARIRGGSRLEKESVCFEYGRFLAM